jgi:hypothetical protein
MNGQQKAQCQVHGQEEAHNEKWIKQEHHCAKPKTMEVA